MAGGDRGRALFVPTVVAAFFQIRVVHHEDLLLTRLVDGGWLGGQGATSRIDEYDQKK